MTQKVKELLAKPEKPELDPWDAHDGRREMTPMNCSLTSKCAPWCKCIHTHMYKYTNEK